MEKQTAVEWFADHLKLVDKNAYNDLIEILEQAKQMEEVQIVKAWNKGYENQSPMSDEDNCGQAYYNETYVNK